MTREQKGGRQECHGSRYAHVADVMQAAVHVHPGHIQSDSMMGSVLSIFTFFS